MIGDSLNYWLRIDVSVILCIDLWFGARVMAFLFLVALLVFGLPLAMVELELVFD